MYDLFVEADNAGYIMAATTVGSGDNAQQNGCGIYDAHAYTIIHAFTMTDSYGVDHRCLLMHNPWGSNDYTYTWSADDSNWTQDLID